MDHSYYQDRTSAYHDHELTDYEEQAVREHLLKCEVCRELLTRLGQLDGVVASHSGLGEDEYWEQSALRIESKIAAMTETQPKAAGGWFGLGWKITAAAASVAFLTFIGLHQSDILNPEREGFQYRPELESSTVRSDPQSTRGRGTIEDGAEKLMRQEEPVEQVPKPSAQVEAASQAVVPEKTEVITRDDISVAPVTTVEELLTQTSGVITNSKGEVYIRGGRAGEVSYIVDSVNGVLDGLGQAGADLDLIGAPAEQDEAATVKGRSDTPATSAADQIAPPQIEAEAEQRIMRLNETAKRAVIPDKVGVMPPRAIPDSVTVPPVEDGVPGASIDAAIELDLEGWIHRRDSLEARWKELNQKEKNLTVRLNSITKSLDRARGVERQLLESYYNIARIAEGEDQEVFDGAVGFLQDYLQREGSRHPRMARDYLRRLGFGPK